MPNVTLKLAIGHLSVEVTGPTKYAEKKLEELVNRYLPGVKLGPTEGAVKATPARLTKKIAPSEFMRKASPRNQTDRALGLAYYLENFQGVESFTTAELTEAGKVAKQRSFTNISDTVARAVSQGLFMSAGEKEGGRRAYALTTSGEEYVESMLESKS